MRIGLVTPAWPGTRTANGITTSVKNLAYGLKETGHHVSIIALEIDAPNDTQNVHEVQYRPWTLSEKIGAKLRNMDTLQTVIGTSLAATVKQAIAADSLDAIIMEETQGWAWHVQQAVSVPVIITLHGPWLIHKTFSGKDPSAADRRREAREQRAFQNCSAITAPSKDVLRTIQANIDLPDVPQTVIANAIMPEPDTVMTPTPDSLLFIGRFDLHKGGDVMINGFAKLAETHTSARLTFVGPDLGIVQDDGTHLAISDLIDTLPDNARSAITVTGPLAADKVAALRPRHAVTVIASRFEVLNYTLLEAMAIGSAIVCSNVGGPADVLRHEETALLVPPGDPDALAAACARLLDDPALAASLGRAAQSYARTHFSPAAIAEQTTALVNATRS